MNIILFLLIIGVLVLVHEFGHFIVAKKSGIRVDEFAIGFPPKLFSWKRGETRYALNLIPFGGYVKIFGENPDQDSLQGPDKKRSFVHKPRYIQAAVLVAGVMMNVLFAWVLFSVAIMIGLPAPSGYAGDKQLVDSKTAVVAVFPDTPAEKVGLKTGDAILSIAVLDQNGAVTKDIIQNGGSEAVQKFIGSHGEAPLKLTLSRKNEIKELIATPVTGLVEGRAALGISLGQVGILKLPFFESFIEGAKISYYMLGTIAVGLYELVKSGIMGQGDFSQVSGPVGIVGMVGEAQAVSFTYLLSFVAMISLNLAVINLLPFPALDGGRLLFVALEGITRRKIKPQIANALNIGGFAVLMLLMVVVTYQDILKLF